MCNYSKCKYCINSVQILTYTLRYWDRKAEPKDRYICKINNDIRVDKLDKNIVKNCKYFKEEINN